MEKHTGKLMEMGDTFLSLPGSLESLSLIGQFVTKATAQAGLDPKAAYRLRLAVDEFAANAIVHGYQEAGLTGNLELRADVDDRNLTITLEDSGRAFDPKRVAPPDPARMALPLEDRPIGGLGIYLALKGVDEFRHERVGDRNRNIFVMHRSEASRDCESGRLLIVENEQTSREVLSSMLIEAGHRVDTASNGKEALEKIKLGQYDLILLDVRMPVMDGVEMLERLRVETGLHDIPVIVVSPASEIETVVKMITLGAEDYISKPFNPTLLRTRINACLQKKRLSEQSSRLKQELKGLKKMEIDLRQVILPLGIALSAERNFDRLQERILSEAKSICNADAGSLYLRTKDDQLKFVIVTTDSLKLSLGGTTGHEVWFPPLPLYDPGTGQPNNRNVATYVALQGRSVNIPDIYQAEGFDFSGTKVFDKNNGYRSTSCLTVPLKDYEGRVIGVLQLLNAIDPQTKQVISFDSGYLQTVVESLSSQAAVALNNQMLLERQKETVKLERDLQIGRQIQMSFLPNTLLQPRGWEIAAGFRPAREVSGDFYDVIPLFEDRIGLIIADVCDKGVGAALFMALFRSLMRAFAQQVPISSPIMPPNKLSAASFNERLAALLAEQQVLNALNAVVLTNNYIIHNHLDANMFATLFIGVLDPSTGSLSYVNAGHNPPVLFSSSGVKAFLPACGPAVGMLPDSNYELKQIEFRPGDTLFAFTDGVTEARDPAGKMFTQERLLPLLTNPFSSVASLVDRVDAALRAHIADAVQFDDITMLAVQRVGEGDLKN